MLQNVFANVGPKAAANSLAKINHSKFLTIDVDNLSYWVNLSLLWSYWLDRLYQFPTCVALVCLRFQSL